MSSYYEFTGSDPRQVSVATVACAVGMLRFQRPTIAKSGVEGLSALELPC
ncbi:MAG: hypothetical protein KF752_13120 [Pirellulaceae bacterium]|nr:hypothetical protein [Pirellulaceae bacterium]